MTKGKAIPADGQMLSLRLDAETLAGLEELAAALGETREHLLVTAAMRFVAEELACLPPAAAAPLANLPPYQDPSPEGQALDRAGDEAARAFAAFVKVGEEDVARGRVFSQEEMEEWFAQRVAARTRPAAAE